MSKPTQIRWKIAGLLCTLAMVNFFQRVNISVVADSMMQAFQLTQTQMGSVFSAFVLGYNLFQVPGGMLADRFGPRRVLGWATLSWGLFTFLTGMIGKLAALAKNLKRRSTHAGKRKRPRLTPKALAAVV